MKVCDLSGVKFGRLTAIKRMGAKDGNAIWECKCECGDVRDYLACNLKKSASKSCGCLHRELASARAKAHGMTRTNIYNLWSAMMDRCYLKTSQAYENYGGRGIFVEKSWHDFSVFYDDMGEKPRGLTLDRIDNDGPYSKTNCRWRSYQDQMRNRRSNVVLEIDGQSKCLAEWCDIYKINYATAYSRIFRNGWVAKIALSTPPTREAWNGI